MAAPANLTTAEIDAKVKPTAEIPVIDSRRERMLRGWYNAGYRGLMKVMYTLAAEDEKEWDDKPNPNMIRSVGYSSSAMLLDARGPREMYSLLCTMSDRVIESLLLNTFGHEL